MKTYIDLNNINIEDNKSKVKNRSGVYAPRVIVVNGSQLGVSNFLEYFTKRHQEVVKMYLELGLLTEVNKLKNYLKLKDIDLSGNLLVDSVTEEYLSYFEKYHTVYKHMLNDKRTVGRLKSLKRGNLLKTYYLLSLVGYHVEDIENKKEGKEYFTIVNTLDTKQYKGVDILTNINLEVNYKEYLSDYVIKYLESLRVNTKKLRADYIKSNGIVSGLSKAYEELCGNSILEEDYTTILPTMINQHNQLTDEDIDEIRVFVNNKNIKNFEQVNIANDNVKEEVKEEIKEEVNNKIQLPKIKKNKLKLPKGMKFKKPTRVERILDMLDNENKENEDYIEVEEGIEGFVEEPTDYNTTTLDDLYDKYNKDSEDKSVKKSLEDKTDLTELESNKKEESVGKMVNNKEDVFGIDNYLNEHSKESQQSTEDSELVVGNTNTPEKPTQAIVGDSTDEGSYTPKLNFEAVDKVHTIFTKVGGKSPARDLYQLLKSKGVEVSVIKDFMSYKNISYYDFLEIENIVNNNVK